MKKLLLALLLCACVWAQPTGIKPPLGTQLDFLQISAQGIVGMWMNQEAAPVGGRLIDLSGFGNHGTLLDDTYSVSGLYGNALRFDAVNDAVNVGTMPSTEGIGALTIVVWARPATTDTFGWVFKQNSGTERWGIYSTGNTMFLFLGTGANTFGSIGGLVTAGSWVQAVMVFDGAGSADADKLKLYYDGTRRTLGFGGPIPATTTAGAANVYLGTFTLDNSVFNGDIDHVIIYNRALSAGEVASLYADPFQMFVQERLPIVAAAAPPPTGGQVIVIMMSKVSPYFVVIGIISILAGLLGYTTRKAA